MYTRTPRVPREEICWRLLHHKLWCGGLRGIVAPTKETPTPTTFMLEGFVEIHVVSRASEGRRTQRISKHERHQRCETMSAATHSAYNVVDAAVFYVARCLFFTHAVIPNTPSHSALLVTAGYPALRFFCGKARHRRLTLRLCFLGHFGLFSFCL